MSYKDEFKHKNEDICNLFKEFFQTVYEEPKMIDEDHFNGIPCNSEVLTDLIVTRDDLLTE